MKNVLSPISDKNISENAAKNPDVPKIDLLAEACMQTAPLGDHRATGSCYILGKPHLEPVQ